MIVYDLLNWLFPFCMIPVAFTVLRHAFNIIKYTMKGNYMPEIDEELMKEEEKKTTNIDEDMMKYFNYKE